MVRITFSGLMSQPSWIHRFPLGKPAGIKGAYRKHRIVAVIPEPGVHTVQ